MTNGMRSLHNRVGWREGGEGCGRESVPSEAGAGASNKINKEGRGFRQCTERDSPLVRGLFN